MRYRQLDHTVETVTTQAWPDLRARVVGDDDPHEPWGDALAPTLVIPYRWPDRARFAPDVYEPASADAIIAAVGRFRQRRCRGLLERYLRIWHGTTTVWTVTGHDSDYLIFDTADYRGHVGMPVPADLSGEAAEWRAYIDGDVYGIVVERRRHGVTSWDDGSREDCIEWDEVDSCWGFYGLDYALSRASELLADAAT